MAGVLATTKVATVAGLLTLAALFDRALSVVGLVRDGRRRRSETINNALMALYAALTETKAYNDLLSRGEDRDRELEYALAMLWQTASIPLRHVDPGLADRCFQKGSYWLDPDVWTTRRVRQNGITLDSMVRSTRELLMDTGRRHRPSVRRGRRS